MKQLEPQLHGQNGDESGMIEIGLRPTVVHGECVIDDNEVHIGVAPVNRKISAEEKGCSDGICHRRGPGIRLRKAKR